jgi:hypothetical protein
MLRVQPYQLGRLQTCANYFRVRRQRGKHIIGEYMRHLGHWLLVVFGVALIAAPAQPCTRYLWNNNKLGVFAARTMDWPGTTESL